MGPVGEVETGDLHGCPHADARQLARICRRGSTRAWHRRARRPASARTARRCWPAPSGSASAACGAMRLVRSTESGLRDHWMPSHVATPCGVDRRTQPRPRRCTTRAPVLTARCTADDSYSRVRSKHTSRSPPPTTRATNDDRPSASRRETVERDVARCRRSRAIRPAGGASRRAWPAGRRSGARCPRGRAGGGRSRARPAARPSRSSSIGQPDALVVELVAQPQHAAPVGVEVGRRRRHGPSLPDTAARVAARRLAANWLPLAQRNRRTFPVTSHGGVAAEPGDHGRRPRPGSATWWSSATGRPTPRTSSVTQPVSVTGGWTTLAVMPNGASSAAADIV